MEEQIRVLAYKKWEDDGCPESDGVKYWVDAENELRSTTVEAASPNTVQAALHQTQTTPKRSRAKQTAE